MRRNILQISILIFVTTVFSYGQSNSWNNLTPLRSTRADVEKLLGKPKDNVCSLGCEYETAKEKIRVSYAYNKCSGAGWSVPTDTVLRITVSSLENSGKSFDQLNLDRNKFSSTIDDAVYGTWTNSEEGLSYYFSNGDKEFIELSYIPKKADNYLRCDGFPPYTPEGQHFTMDTALFYNPKFSKKESLYDVFARIDSFTINLMSDSYKDEYKGYVMVYFDNKLPFKEYKNRLIKVKDHIFKRRKISAERLSVIEGGMQEESRIEFYILPKQWKPPAPNPTLPSPQFMKTQ
jgi:hypothetical protein